MANIANKPFDPSKLKRVLKEKGLNLKQASEEMGYCPNSLSSAINRGTMAGLMLRNLRKDLGITYEMIQPDEEEPKEEQHEQHDEEQKAEPAVDFSSILDKMDEAIELLKNTRKGTNEETIAQGLKWGLEMFWTDHKKEITEQLAKSVKGCIFAGNLEALRKHDELLDERAPYREFIKPVK